MSVNADSDMPNPQEGGGSESTGRPSDGAEDRADKPNIGRFQIERPLGKGGFGNVFLAWDPQLRRQVAVKVPRLDKPLHRDARERFLYEGRMLAQVDHPAVATVHDVDMTDDGVPFVVMQYIEGRPLSELIKAREVDSGQAVRILIKIASALQHAHKRGVTHRDLKPANIIIDPQQEVRLVDFGLALHEDMGIGELEDSGAFGTPNYMAPEQIRGENHLIDGRTDVWGLGVTMYVMLVRQLPFRGSGYRELLRSICYKHPRPLRQLDETVPRGLERICLRCLQKLMEDRYQSMADVLEELEAFESEGVTAGETAAMPAHDDPLSIRELRSVHPSDEPAASPGSGNASGSSRTHSEGLAGTSSDRIEIVPKGLRSFDQNDREFFLQLLPGPTDRHGVPESIRFWLARLGLADQVEDVPIGILYGPSGCGKSSFVRAGLMPRLPEGVIPIYIDATAVNVSDNIVERIVREFHEAPVGVPLPELLRRIRHGHLLRPGDRLLLVLDQFEQWLNRCDDYSQHSLTEALRQCDAERVQALLLIRDDFWISASQFLRCLDRRIEEGKNAMSLPLFDERHARRVLEALGRAHGSLPRTDQPLDKSQSRFIAQVVESLAQRNKVICVHLAVFAETAKARDWGQIDYREVGGWEGIGREFIAGIFNDPETPSYVKRHSSEAWRILQALLPASDAELKGNLVRRMELRTLAGLEAHPARFEQLMEFLEFEAHLIAPMEDEDVAEQVPGESRRGGDQTLVGLTHDFLVRPIRAWGLAKQNETRRGRAESLLGQLADQWSLTRDPRFFPSIWDFGRIALFAGRDAKRQAGDFWPTTRRRFQVWFATFAGLAAIGAFMFSNYHQRNVQRLVLAATEQYLNCPADEIVRSRETVEKNYARSRRFLIEATESEVLKRRLRALALIVANEPGDLSRLHELLAMIDIAEPWEFGTFYHAIGNQPPHVMNDLATRSQEIDGPKARARIALLFAQMGVIGPLEAVCRLSSDPTPRTHVLLELKVWNLSLDRLLHTLVDAPEELDGPLASALAGGLSLIDHESLNPLEYRTCRDFLERVYTKHASGGAHFAAQHALEKWDLELPIIETAVEGAEWHVFRFLASADGKYLELPMVKIPAGHFKVGSGMESFRMPPGEMSFDGVVERDFWIAVFETDIHSFDIFRQSLDADDLDRLALESSEHYQQVLALGTARLPAVGMTWSQANRFCEWLTDELYRIVHLKTQDGVLPESTPEAARFRLPTLEEFELAQRAQSSTRFFFGNDMIFLPYFGDYANIAEPSPSGRFMPNGFGCFDLSGNVREWTSQIYSTEVWPEAATKGGQSWDPFDGFASAKWWSFSAQSNRFRIGIRLVFADDEETP